MDSGALGATGVSAVARVVEASRRERGPALEEMDVLEIVQRLIAVMRILVQLVRMYFGHLQ